MTKYMLLLAVLGSVIPTVSLSKDNSNELYMCLEPKGIRFSSFKNKGLSIDEDGMTNIIPIISIEKDKLTINYKDYKNNKIIDRSVVTEYKIISRDVDYIHGYYSSDKFKNNVELVSFYPSHNFLTITNNKLIGVPEKKIASSYTMIAHCKSYNIDDLL